MLELVTLVWTFVVFFALAGFQRGWTKEIISMAGNYLGPCLPCTSLMSLFAVSCWPDLPPA